MMTDPIADMFTRMRNANEIGRPQVDVPHSRLKEQIVQKLKEEGFITDYKIMKRSPQSVLTVYLKYGPDGEKVIRSIQKVSKPGRRIYQGATHLKKILGGMGISVLSTSRGILTDRECREQKVGGEVIGIIW